MIGREFPKISIEFSETQDNFPPLSSKSFGYPQTPSSMLLECRYILSQFERFYDYFPVKRTSVGFGAQFVSARVMYHNGFYYFRDTLNTIAGRIVSTSFGRNPVVSRDTRACYYLVG